MEYGGRRGREDNSGDKIKEERRMKMERKVHRRKDKVSGKRMEAL